jgi:quercetin 2,3-dioxygenase
LGAHSVIDTSTPIIYLHFTIQPGAEIIQPIPKEYNVFAYVISGKGTFTRNNDGAKIVYKGQMVVFGNDGSNVFIKSSTYNESQLEVLLIGGVPLNEPISQYGPFVMNTKEEIHQAMEDYRNGKMGKINF